MKSNLLIAILILALAVVTALLLIPPAHKSGSTPEVLSTSSAAPGPTLAPKGNRGAAPSAEQHLAVAEHAEQATETAQTPALAQPGQPATATAQKAKLTEAQKKEEQRQIAVQERIAELFDLAMEDDAASLQTIVAELTNEDKEIREAAVEAVKQFGSRDAIPELEAAAQWTDDPVERAEYREAVEFLQLPTLSELRAGK